MEEAKDSMLEAATSSRTSVPSASPGPTCLPTVRSGAASGTPGFGRGGGRSMPGPISIIPRLPRCRQPGPLAHNRKSAACLCQLRNISTEASLRRSRPGLRASAFLSSALHSSPPPPLTPRLRSPQSATRLGLRCLGDRESGGAGHSAGDRAGKAGQGTQAAATRLRVGSATA